MTEPLSSTDYERLHEFRYVIRRFLHFSEEAAREAGVDPRQHQLLLTIRARGPAHGLSIVEIAERLQLRHNSAVELVDRAGERGFVLRTPSPDDGRRVLVSLTAQGVEVLERLSADHITELRSYAPELVRVLESLVPAAPEAAR